MPNAIVLDTTLAYATHGRSVLYILPRTKFPKGLNWKQYQTTPATEARIRAWFADKTRGVCILTGAISGYVDLDGILYALEIIDFDEAGLYDLFCEQARFFGLSDLLQRLPTETTPRNGHHIGYLCQAIEGNQKLAMRDATAEELAADPKVKTKARIETRGEGGLCVVAPTPPGIHPERPEHGYVMVQGSWTEIPIITPEERQQLLDIARSFQTSTTVLPTANKTARDTSRPEAALDHDQPGDHLNATADRAWWRTLLETHGWTLLTTRQHDDVEMWQRPGKQPHEGASATLGATGTSLYVFSSSAAPLEGQRAYAPFSAYTRLEHGGDTQAAAKALAREGYGTPATEQRSNGTPTTDIHEDTIDPHELAAMIRAQLQDAETPDAQLIYQHINAFAFVSTGDWEGFKAGWKDILGKNLNLNALGRARNEARQATYRQRAARLMHHEQSATPQHHEADEDIQLQLTANGGVKESLVNYALIFRQHHAWKDRLAYDMFAGTVMFEGKPITDEDMTNIGINCGLAFGFDANNSVVRALAINSVAHARSYDSLQNFLHTLPVWDEEERLWTWLHTFAGAGNEKYTQWVGGMTILQMIARGLNPGCIARYVTILEGAEGTKKSTLVSILGHPWDKTFDMNMESKEAHMFVQGCWVAELSELSAMRRSQEARVKSFLTLCHDQYIPKYANTGVSYPRRTVFIGTTNDEAQYLTGQTGNTRFLPVKTRTLDLEGLQDHRDQLLAEALTYYKDHPDDWWQPPFFLEDILKEEREDRREYSSWEEPLRAWLAKESSNHFALGDIMAGALNIPKAEWVRHQKAAGTAMRALGWEYRRIWMEDGSRIRAWQRPTPAEQDETF